MPTQQLITHARGHVTGEYAQNTVYLTGERVSDAGFYQNIRLSVQPSIGSAARRRTADTIHACF